MVCSFHIPQGLWWIAIGSCFFGAGRQTGNLENTRFETRSWKCKLGNTWTLTRQYGPLSMQNQHYQPLWLTIEILFFKNLKTTSRKNKCGLVNPEPRLLDLTGRWMLFNKKPTCGIPFLVNCLSHVFTHIQESASRNQTKTKHSSQKRYNLYTANKK